MACSGREAVRESILPGLIERYPEKFPDERTAFSKIHRGDRIFIGTGCGAPQYLIQALVRYVESYPKAFVDTEIFNVWTMGVASYTDEKFKSNFRHNSFFVGNTTRDAVNKGLADYTPVFLSQVPALFENKLVPLDVALVQFSPPDKHGFMSLGISVDIVKAAVRNSDVVIGQINSYMPRVHGDTFVNIDDVDALLWHDEPLLDYNPQVPNDIADWIGKYVSRIVQDGDTIQVGYGSIPNTVLEHLHSKKHLGVHTELFTNGLMDLMELKVIDNSKKTLHRYKSTATFCMGNQDTYDFISDNPGVEFRTIDHTNDPLIISRNKHMTSINSCLQIDLTGQATSESLGPSFYSGIGGQADFMRGAIMSEGGKTILTLKSTAINDTVSRIVPFVDFGAGVTLNRGDVHYVVTEYGIAYLHGKNIRERAMDLIAIAHPKFRKSLIEEAKRYGLIYKDQAFIPGKRGEYPENLETRRTTRSGLKIVLRPVKLNDEPLLKDFFYSLSDQSIYKRFISSRTDMPHERLQEFVVIDYTKEMVILVIDDSGEKEKVVGVGQYGIEENTHTAEVALVVRDEAQNKGIGSILLSYLTNLAKKQGLLGFTAEVLVENKPMLHLFEKMGFDIQKRSSSGVYELRMAFRGIT
jgi:acyl-CoA hydrolase/ribosomal protein S18 acetylase RimI-like enzyme